MHKSTIIWNENQTPISVHFDDVYFNTEGAIEETRYVFIDGNDLPQRFLQHKQDTFIVGETGFGSGLSFLILWQTFLNFRSEHPNHILKHLAFFSVEKYPLSLDELIKIHDNVVSKNETLFSLAKQLQASLIDSTCQFDNVSLTICYDDIRHFSDFLVKKNVLIDAWFFDGFSPAKNPDMWSECLFNNCFSLTAPGGSFATFTAAGFVRRHLMSAGFTVEKRKGFGAKREMLVGYK
ncbi:tRNA 5-methylaminomethyl-2-thiouridine biosynthesis bifunctional protein [Gilliamella bombicola]|uniref:tRNA 5-methylaminomethyl-2-thiouridine biosynthesis bifunctional protein n=1 Tax=Gilliamella bombicola TaxID=1798182 RepID=A0A1C4CQ14_9GAMM|nr:tRNA (5-methylaminomethyl-2-thiouridine)(34)-methyltransferase MnmD [Gilliamella bombicola]SCC21172.1 tRNA 5-methylaminomethyl-2-thiouridine biosynthesis bifunctional protein [Gilliamella bombicola]